MNWRATAGHKVSVADSDSDDWDTEADYENKVAEKDLKSAARTHGEKVFRVLSKPNYQGLFSLVVIQMLYNIRRTQLAKYCF